MKKLFKIEIASDRIFGLDILRALAILFVVIGHGSLLLPQELSRLSDYLAFDGVSIFFVLSGYLIGGILIKLIHEKGFSIHILRSFWIRRWYRTLPNYFLILIILCIIHLIFDDQFTLIKVGRYFAFSQNLFTEHPSWFFPEAWSLSVEEWFYLIFPILVFLSFLYTKSLPKSIFFVALLIIVLITAFRLYRFSNVVIGTTEDWDILFRKQVVTRLDSLMFGVVGAYLSYFHRSFWIKYKTALLFVGILLLFAAKFIMHRFTGIDSIYYCVFSFTMISIGTLCLLPYLSELKSSNGFLYKPITYISLISYSMYLINLSLVQTWIIRNIPWQNLSENEIIATVACYSTFWLLVIGLSILLYKYFELPMTSLRDRFK